MSTVHAAPGWQTSAAPVRDDAPARPPRRVREEVRDGLAVVAFSAVASSALALALLVLGSLAR